MNPCFEERAFWLRHCSNSSKLDAGSSAFWKAFRQFPGRWPCRHAFESRIPADFAAVSGETAPECLVQCTHPKGCAPLRGRQQRFFSFFQFQNCLFR